MEARKLKNLLKVLRESGVRVYKYKDSEYVVSLVLGEKPQETEPDYEQDPEMGPLSDDSLRAEIWSA